MCALLHVLTCGWSIDCCDLHRFILCILCSEFALILLYGLNCIYSLSCLVSGLSMVLKILLLFLERKLDLESGTLLVL